MTKELSPLEAYYKLDHTCCLNDNKMKYGLIKPEDCEDDPEDKDCNNVEEMIYCLELVETALKEYEGAKNHIEALNKERVENSIKIKAFEIIKEKRVNVLELYTCADYETYISFFKMYNWNGEYDKYILTKEEYDLLKEVLL